MKRDIIFNRITKVMLFHLALLNLILFLGIGLAWNMDPNVSKFLIIFDILLLIMSTRAFWKFKIKNIYDNDGMIFLALMVCVGLEIHNVFLSKKGESLSQHMIFGIPLLIHGVWYIIQLIRKKGF